MSRPILIVDGLNLFMQHFVANPSMSSHGNHVGGVVGFMKAIAHLCDKTGPKDILVVWEGGGSLRKRAIYKDYKGGRRPQRLNRYYGEEIPDTVQNRDDELSMLISLLRRTPVRQVYVSDCEADDVIGYISRHCLENEKIVIVSSDKDLYQLLSPRVIQWSPGQKSFVTMKTVREKFGVHVNNICTVRSFVGDPSDNIPGIPRAGFASMSKRFPDVKESNFVSVEDIIESSRKNIENKSLKIYTNIIENSDVAKRNWKIMLLDTRNLSAHQIEKIEFFMENKENSLDKISFVRELVKNGINNFDADSFYSSLRAVVRRT